MKLAGKTILITGASSGLGRGMAVALSHHGNNLIVTARRTARLEALAQEVETHGSRCVVVAGDATDAGLCREVLEAGYAAFGRIDAAVLNAGGASALSMADASVEQITHAMALNYDTLVNFLFPLIDHMRDAGGTIAYTSSPAGMFGLPRSGAYSAAKAAGRVLFDSCRIDLAHTPIRFVAMYPGFTYTEGLDVENVPVKALIIDQERAVREMIDAIERGRSHHLFPKRIEALMALGRGLPEAVRRFVLSRAV